MGSPASDRNLLLGILALQMDFISREALVAAMHAWVLDKDRSLGAILQGQGALPPDNRVLLEALVQRHLEMHHNDPQKSLAAVSSIRSVRQELLEVADDDVQASLVHVAASRPSEEADATTPAETRAAGPRFQILRPHARGGLGEVFVARDRELDREVALKEIQERHAGQPEHRSRFLTEARVTGALEHPSIVPVYGLGTYADGRPFYAMRFIKGDSLKDAIAAFHNAAGMSDSQRSLALRQLLGRFVDVCNAIAYAHSRGVLHRDLKPGNVMLGKYGETLVVDWGLAKVLGTRDAETTEVAVVNSVDSTLTQTGQALGTPAFMSPEQASGRQDVLGPRSDVYSLGATLFCLLAGRAPFSEGDFGQILGKVQRGDFPPPRQVNSRVPPALEAICLRAMALKPDDRYPTPRDLAEEIEHWLADEPVRAYPEPLRVRAGRWSRRHPAVVTGTAALVLTALVAVTASSLLLAQEQERTLTEQAAKLREEEKAREARQGRVLAQVDALLNAAPQAVPALRRGLDLQQPEVRARLLEAASSPRPEEATDDRMRLWRQHRTRAALALLGEEGDQVPVLLERLLEAKLDPAEMLLVRDSLHPHADRITERLWQQSAERESDRRFPALVALAAYDPASRRWEKSLNDAVADLLRSNPLHLALWTEALRPIRKRLVPELEAAYRNQDEKAKRYRPVAAHVLIDYAADQPELLANLLLDADTEQYATLLPALTAHREQAVAAMSAELARTIEPRKDRPLDPTWKAPTADERRAIEQAAGLIEERFALCQTLPLNRLSALAEGLRPAGYRPIRVRPWNDGEQERVAIVWTRDGRDWRLVEGASRTELLRSEQALSKDGFTPLDVAGYVARGEVPAERYSGVWVRKNSPQEEARIYAGASFNEHQSAYRTLEQAGFGYQHSLQAFRGTDGQSRYCGVKTRRENQGSWSWNQTAADFEGKLSLDKVVWDFAVSQADRAAPLKERGQHDKAAWYTTVWQPVAGIEAATSHGLAPDDHLRVAREKIRQGYRPVALSAASVEGQAVTASVWHRPEPSPADQERGAKRRALAAITLLHLNQPAAVWPLWRHSPDPTARSYLVERVNPLGVEGRLLLQRLEVEQDVSARRALILALGEYSEKDLPAAERDGLVKRLLGWYRDDPDPGIHGAIDWLLRHGREGPEPRKLDWGQAKSLAAIDAERAAGVQARRALAAAGRTGLGTGGLLPGLTALWTGEADWGEDVPARPGSAGWTVNGQGQSFTLIRGPVEFRMGSPPSEVDRSPVEKLHLRVIPRSFALATKSVTVAQWQQFLKERPEVKHSYTQRFSPEPDGPIVAVTFFDAMQYCNWLSEKEGIPREQWCYPEKIEPGMKPHPDYLRRTGYRLPSEAEWEYACRAGSVSSHYYGSPKELLPRYAWYIVNSQDRAWPVGQKRPNDLGLFDMQGNAWTWCQNAAFVYPGGRVLDREDNRDITDSISRVLRGGAFNDHPASVRSANRNVNRPTNRSNNVGLRVARTYH